MPLWESPEQKSQREAKEATRRALERGQIPYRARHRLETQRQSTESFFSSNLSCQAHLLTREAGYEPIGLVMGTAFYNVSFWGYFNAYRTFTGELTQLSHAQLAARELAIARLRQEAKLLGAHGVIGVQLTLRNYNWSARTVEFTAVGTAIRLDEPVPADPFTSDLSAQEFWQLYQAGYAPRGLVFGICSYYIHTDWNTQSLTRGGFLGRGGSRNQEVTQYTQGFNLARHLAMNRLTDDIRQHHAQGAVGMKISTGVEDIEYELNDRTYHDLLAHFVAVGTSIAPRSVSTDDRKSPLLIYDLASGKSKPLQVDSSS